ncbi:hypothetical protein B0H10DRAFT_2233724 [Mycena sp. CBHHK59/15]|nr:hypothetical protein B0H10DRAFT_2233724 [Mycena sp. CBHHK59/15]
MAGNTTITVLWISDPRMCPHTYPPPILERGTVTLGTVFLCTAAYFSGYCVRITGEFIGGCIDLGVDLDNQVSSFGPGAFYPFPILPCCRSANQLDADPGQTCVLYKHVFHCRQKNAAEDDGEPSAHGCATSGEGTPAWTGPVAYPGVPDLSQSFVGSNGAVNAPFNDICPHTMYSVKKWFLPYISFWSSSYYSN